MKMVDFVAGMERLPLHLTVVQISAVSTAFADEKTGLVDVDQFIKVVAPDITAL